MVIREFRGLSYVDFPSEYCLVDIETTGLNLYSDEIIEIGAIKYAGGKITGQFQTLTQPAHNREGIFVDSFIETLTGITNEMLSSAPKMHTAIREFADFLGDSIIVGYNVSFDVNFLYDAFVKHLERPLTNNFVDILRISRKLCAELPSCDLDSVMHHFGIDSDSRHRAIGDCVATQQIYERLQEVALRKYATLEDFGKTFNIVDIKKQIAEKTDNEILEVWEQNLYTCPSVYKAFKFFEKLNLKKTQLIEFADYLGVAIYT